jgi:hypothetical protein
MLASVQSHQLAVAGINGRNISQKFYSFIARVAFDGANGHTQFIQRLSERKTVAVAILRGRPGNAAPPTAN